MTKLFEHIAGVHGRLAGVAHDELELLKALRTALERVDKQLLEDVRAVRVEHEARRGAILTELHGLAASIGAFPALAAPAAENAPQIPSYTPSPEMHAQPRIRGDWRQATRNIEDDDLDFDVDYPLNGHGSH